MKLQTLEEVYRAVKQIDDLNNKPGATIGSVFLQLTDKGEELSAIAFVSLFMVAIKKLSQKPSY